jgi:hypothetical protein
MVCCTSHQTFYSGTKGCVNICLTRRSVREKYVEHMNNLVDETCVLLGCNAVCNGNILTDILGQRFSPIFKVRTLNSPEERISHQLCGRSLKSNVVDVLTVYTDVKGLWVSSLPSFLVILI